MAGIPCVWADFEERLNLGLQEGERLFQVCEGT